MTLLAFVLSAAALAGVGLLLVVLFGVIGPPSRMPVPVMAAPRPAIDCAIPSGLASPRPFNPAIISSGLFHCPSMTLSGGDTISLTGDIIIVADGTIQVDGDINRPPGVAGIPGASITLISLNGDVVVGLTGNVGQLVNYAGDGIPSTATAIAADARAQAGSNGGYVKLAAPHGSIDIRGKVRGQDGGAGGAATATGIVSGGFIPTGGSAIAVGAQGGAGGDVLLCALDAITIGAKGLVLAGHAGFGGAATASAVNAQDAKARAGPGNTAGSIHVTGPAPTSSVQVSINGGMLRAGYCLKAGLATATGGNGARGLDDGGFARADGGEGGEGGTVKFSGAQVVTNAGHVIAQFGGDGEDGIATGGTGKPAGRIFPATRGGNAYAAGGKGGPPGAIPQIPLAAGGFAQGTYAKVPPAADTGTGGTGRATGGTGGIASAPRTGGDSGRAEALGGPNGRAGVPPPALVTAPAATAIGPAGAPGPVAVSPGA